jgi:hypothetical protein
MDHYKRLENTVKLFPSSEVTIYLRVENWSYDWKDHFTSHQKYKIILAGHNQKFWLRLMLVARKYDKIFVNSGPDFEQMKTLSLFFIFCTIYGRKTNVFLCNPVKYLRKKNICANMSDWLRNFSIYFVKFLSFETETQKKHFLKCNKSKKACSVIYDRHLGERLILNTDTLLSKEEKNNKINIGLLGTLDPNRRNYDLLLESIKKLDTHWQEKIEIVTLGAYLGVKSDEVISKFKEIIELNSTTGWLTEEEFLERGKKCDVLISPLSEKKKYGTLAGTGSFGDAVFLQKKIILPNWVDPEKEFNPIAIYYDSYIHLTKKLELIMNNKIPLEVKSDLQFFKRFRTKNIIYQSNNDLNQIFFG